ncbi:MAG: PAS domain S-box protein [Deltaproteobacteria bacterium]|nr:PAS domain S-box protein [Deltaproteobacteria bacterium]
MKEAHDPNRELLAALKQSEERYRSITETSVDAIITSNAQDRIVTWNKGAERIFGWGQEIVGRPVTTIVPPAFRAAHREGVRRFLASGYRHLIGRTAELMGYTKDGREFPLELSLSTWEGADGLMFGAIIRDISERKRLERLREDVHRIMRHDLKSPLVGITGLAKLILSGDNLTPRQKKSALMIRELGERMLGFIGRARDLFMLEEGSYQLEPLELDLLAVARRVKTELTPLAQAKEVELVLTLAGAPARGRARYAVMGDEGLLDMMLANLMKNAVEASPRGGRVSVDLAPSPRPDGPAHRLVVHNQGEIPPEVQDKLFQPYVTMGKKEGTGLGAYSAWLTVQAHHGEISFTTSPEEGTCLIVTLPADPRVVPSTPDPAAGS